MTYAFTRRSSQGNTLHDRLRAQFGERAARSVSLGLEAKRRKQEAQNAANNAGVRPMPNNAVRNGDTRYMNKTPNAADSRGASPAFRAARPAYNQQNARPANPYNQQTYQRPAYDPQARPANPYGQQAYQRPAYDPQARPANPYGQQAYQRPAYDPQARPANPYGQQAYQRPAYNAQARPANPYNQQAYQRPAYGPQSAPEYAGRHSVETMDNPYIIRFSRMRKPVTGKSDVEISIATFPHLYRRGAQMRNATQIAKATPTPGALKMHFIKLKESLFPTGQHNAEVRVRRAPFPVGAVALLLVLTITLMVTISSFAELGDLRSDISKLEAEQSQLQKDENRLTGLIENREDIRIIKGIAIDDYGMVSSNLAKNEYISTTDSDRVEVIEDDSDNDEGFFGAILTAIAGNLGAISEYFN